MDYDQPTLPLTLTKMYIKTDQETGERILVTCANHENIEDAEEMAELNNIKKISHTICKSCFDSLYGEHFTQEEIAEIYDPDFNVTIKNIKYQN